MITLSFKSFSADFTIQVQPIGGSIQSFKIYENGFLFAKQNLSSTNTGNYILTTGVHEGSVFNFSSNNLTDLQLDYGPLMEFNNGFVNGICYFATTDCSGQCYLGVSEGQTGSTSNNLKLLQTTIFKSGAIYYKSSTTDLVIKSTENLFSRRSGGSCSVVSTNPAVYRLNAYTVPTVINDSSFPRVGTVVRSYE